MCSEESDTTEEEGDILVSNVGQWCKEHLGKEFPEMKVTNPASAEHLKIFVDSFVREGNRVLARNNRSEKKATYKLTAKFQNLFKVMSAKKNSEPHTMCFPKEFETPIWAKEKCFGSNESRLEPKPEKIVCFSWA